MIRHTLATKINEHIHKGLHIETVWRMLDCM